MEVANETVPASRISPPSSGIRSSRRSIVMRPGGQRYSAISATVSTAKATAA